MHVVADFHVSDHAHATRKSAVGAYDRASGQTAATGYRGIFPDAAVVPNLYQVVDDRTVRNDGMTQGAPVHGRAGADFNAVANTHPSQLAHLLPAGGSRRKPETLRPQYRLGMNDAMLTHVHIVVNHGIGQYPGTRTNATVMADIYTRTK